MVDKIIIIGNGIAAITAIKSIREIDQEIEIHLFGEEPFYPYNRVRLSKGLLGSLEEEKILIQKKEWYEVNNVKLYTDIKVVSIDVNNKSIRTSKGDRFDYSKLLIATGAHNFKPPIPGIDKSGVYTLRTLKDAWNIKEKVKDKQEILNIGGGIQGLETAWILSQMGKKVSLIELLPRLMPRQLDEQASRILEKAVRSHGIEVMLDTQVNEILGEDKVEGIRTAQGQVIGGDMITYSIGIRPNIDFLKDTPIRFNKGVIVDKKMGTSIEGIYAAGDVAEYENEIYGLWNIAIGHGKVAGYNMVGKDEIYEHIVPVTTLSAFGLSLFSMGVIENSKATDVVLEDRSAENVYNKVYIHKNKIIGAIVIGDIRHSPALKTAIENEIDLNGIHFNTVSFHELIEIIKKRK
ncbi:nitrite reductase (NADH) large subunit [Anaerosolibacter carboniphilus]|uniref:Nitrite reductase (NADH) large subunit n=1 Tax=Anaerosolibacter carboniphilus TaxID=1417629 RepID=A0A841KXX4_9FIRM|nr:nitrite reductase (NADH) large subunit [Anaerosolibacter carboniphilus]